MACCDQNPDGSRTVQAADKAHAAWNLEQASFFRNEAFYQKRLCEVLYKLIRKEGE